MTGCTAISRVSFFANSDNKSERRSVLTPTHGGDAFNKELVRDHNFGSSGLNLAFEGLLLGASLCLQAKATLSNPCKLGPRVCNASAQCEGGSVVFYRKSETPKVAREGLGERARKKVSRSRRRRTRAEGVTPIMFQRLPHVSTSLGSTRRCLNVMD
jgi:hypothetical protein